MNDNRYIPSYINDFVRDQGVLSGRGLVGNFSVEGAPAPIVRGRDNV